MKLRPLVKIHGGKRYLVDFILNSFPKNYESLKYYEGCGGAGSIILNKEKSIYEVYNDIDSGLVSIFKELNNPEFIQAVKNTEYNEETFNWSKTCNTPLAELVRRRFSRGGLQKAFSWSNRLRGNQPGDKNSWDTFKNEIIRIADRMKDVKIYCMPVIELIEKFDNYDVFWYLDTPYLPSTRQSQKVYSFEMTEEDHIELAKVLNNIKGKVALSGYYSSLYAKMYNNWNMKVKEMPNHSSQAKIKQKRIECLWINY